MIVYFISLSIIELYPKTIWYFPDMIGGNGYNTILPDRELFVRWMQANVFMPAMQFSYTPWDYNDEVSIGYFLLHSK